MSSNTLVIDNYDSCTFNLVQYLGELGDTPQVFRNDQISIKRLKRSTLLAFWSRRAHARPAKQASLRQ